MSRLEQALERLGSGGPAIVADEDRDGLGAVVLAADRVSPDGLRVLDGAGRGAPELILAATGAEWAGSGVSDQARQDGAAVSDAVAPERALPELAERRAQLIRGAATTRDPGTLEDLGILSRRAAIGGVLVRSGLAEAAVDAVRLAGRAPAAVLRTLALPGGVLGRAAEVERLAERHGLPVFTVQDVVAHRLACETIVESAASARLPSAYADVAFEVQAFRSLLDGSEHLAMVHAPLGDAPLVRIHSECLTGDALGSLRCDCGDQLRRSLKLVAENPAGGAVVYLRGQEGRGIGLVNKIRAYALQDLGRDTVQANVELGFAVDLRDYGVAVQILQALGISKLRLLSNNPRKATALERYGIAVSERVALRIGPNPHNANYLETKRLKLGHDLGGRVAAKARK